MSHVIQQTLFATLSFGGWQSPAVPPLCSVQDSMAVQMQNAPSLDLGLSAPGLEPRVSKAHQLAFSRCFL